VAFFQSRGWQAFAIEKTGRYADVLAIKGSSLAIIEVKSIKETSAVKSYDDSANLSPTLNTSIGPFLKTIRQKVFDLFPHGIVIQPVFKGIYGFENGYSLALKENDNLCFIDKTGAIVHELDMFTRMQVLE